MVVDVAVVDVAAVDVAAVDVALETLQVDQRNLEDYRTDPRVVA